MRFIIREVDFKDRDRLFHLAGMFPLCSLPYNKKKLKKKIQVSKESFQQILPAKKRNYLFVLEDQKKRDLIGSSQILSYFGEDQSLCYFLKKQGQKKYLKLDMMKKGKNQLGGLIMHPDYRGSPEKFGLQIGLVRFLYMKAFPKNFSSFIEVSLTAPISKTKNYFWKETGGKSLKMGYIPALKCFQKNRLYFFSLFPKNLQFDLDEMSPKARQYLENVHPQTLPAYKGLLKIGFKKTKCYHTLDGGVYLETKWKDLDFLQKSKVCFIKQDEKIKPVDSFLVSQQTKKGFFCSRVVGEMTRKHLLIKSLSQDFEANRPVLALPFPL